MSIRPIHTLSFLTSSAMIILPLPGASQDFWQQLSGPNGGSISCFAVRSADSILAGTNNGGVYFSADSGVNWQPINTGLSNLNVFALATSGNGTWFLGTFGAGMHRSTNLASGWTQINTGFYPPDVTDIVIGSNGYVIAGSFHGTFRSTDNGDNWTKITTGLTDTTVWALARNTSGHFFAATSGGMFRTTNNGNTWGAINSGLTNRDVRSVTVNRATGHIFAGTNRGGVYRSTNNGSSWTPINTGGPQGQFVNCLAVNPTGYLFAGAFSGGGAGILYRSTNNGSNWSIVFGPSASSINAFDASISAFILAGMSRGAYRSVDEGLTWQKFNSGLRSSSILAFLPDGDSGLYAGTPDGLFRTPDHGLQWSSSGWIDTTVMSIDKTVQGTLLVGSIYGTYRSTDGGSSWIRATTEGARCLVSNGLGHAFAGLDWSPNLLRSTDDGQTWSPANQGLLGSGISSLTIDAAGYIYAGTGTQGVFRSTDNGDNWTQVNNGLSNLYTRSLAHSDAYLYVGTQSGGVFRSTNRGLNWVQSVSGLPLYSIETILPVSDANVYIGTAPGGVYVSTDSGSSWTSLNEGLLSMYIRHLSLDGDHYLYAASDGTGLFRSIHSIDSLRITTFPVAGGWNLVSVPRIVNDPRVTNLFSSAIPPAYSFSQVEGYIQRDTLATSWGYWLKFPSSQSVSISGAPLLVDTAIVQQGWNIIGSLTDSIQVGSITSNPPGIVMGNYYGYDGGYTSTTSLQPGKGYWIKVGQAGLLFLRSASLQRR